MRFILVVSFSLVASVVSAGPFLPDEGEDPFNYWLLDKFHDGQPYPHDREPFGLIADGTAYSMETNDAMVEMNIFADGTGELVGTLQENITGDYHQVAVSMTGINTALLGDDYQWEFAEGIITDPFGVTRDLEFKARDGWVFEFRPDGAGIDNDTTTPVGRGWLVGGGDFHFLAEKHSVPEPAVLLMFGLGLIFVGNRIRR